VSVEDKLIALGRAQADAREAQEKTQALAREAVAAWAAYEEASQATQEANGRAYQAMKDAAAELGELLGKRDRSGDIDGEALASIRYGVRVLRETLQ
jgi:hypothetical protein